MDIDQVWVFSIVVVETPKDNCRILPHFPPPVGCDDECEGRTGARVPIVHKASTSEKDCFVVGRGVFAHEHQCCALTPRIPQTTIFVSEHDFAF